jgi:hypothetical protein
MPVLVRIVMMTLYVLLQRFSYSDPYPTLTCLIPNTNGILPIADGEVWYNSNSQYVSKIKGRGVCNGTGIVLAPDTWHKPMLFVANPPAYRSNFLLYTALQFWARCPVPTAWSIMSLRFGHWVASGSSISAESNIVKTFDYVQSPAAALSGNWTRVRIPLEKFLNSTWTLGGVEYILFNLDSQNRKCTLDNVALIDLVPPIIGNVSIHTGNIISFNVSKRFDVTTARNASLFSVCRSDINPCQPIAPIDGATSVEVTGFNSEYSKLMTHVLFLKFENSFVEGARYTLRIHATFEDAARNSLLQDVFRHFTYSEYRVAKSIQVNQEGYLQHGSKIAYVDQYFMDMGSAVFAVGSKCSVYTRDKFTMAWHKMSAPATCTANGVILNDVGALSESSAYAVGTNGTILFYNGSLYGSQIDYAWRVVKAATPPTSSVTLHAIDFAPNGTGVIVGTSATILYLSYGSDEWVKFSPFPSTALLPLTTKLRDVYMSFDGTVVIVGDEILLAYYRGSWTKSASTKAGAGVFMTTVCGIRQYSDADSTLMFGRNGTNIRFNYGQVYSQTHGTSAYVGADWKNCWVNSARYGQVITVGTKGKIVMMHYDNKFTNVGRATALSSNPTFYDVDCVSNIDCVAVGSGGVISSGASANTNSWTEVVIDSTVSFRGVAAVPAGSLRLAKNQQKMKLMAVGTSGSGSTAVPTYTEVASFDLQLRRANDQLTGGDLWTVNFTSFNAPGTYRIMIGGIGMSTSFVINADALTNAAWHSCRALYYQRSGTALKKPPYVDARWTHGLDHEYDVSGSGRKIDAAYHWSIAMSPLYGGEKVCPRLNKTCGTESMKDGSGGYVFLYSTPMFIIYIQL